MRGDRIHGGAHQRSGGGEVGNLRDSKLLRPEGSVHVRRALHAAGRGDARDFGEFVTHHDVDDG